MIIVHLTLIVDSAASALSYCSGFKKIGLADFFIIAIHESGGNSFIHAFALTYFALERNS
jgi:hypothetical protein